MLLASVFMNFQQKILLKDQVKIKDDGDIQ